MTEQNNTVRAGVLECMRRHAATVHVIAFMDAQGNFLSTTVTSVTLATMDPPTMLVCLNTNTRIGSAIGDVGTFTINTLATGQVSVAAACAGGIDHSQRFAAANWCLHEDGTPYLASAQSSMRCRVANIVTSGTHRVVFGEVLGTHCEPDAAPLMYLNRAYGQFRPSPAHDVSSHLIGW